MPNIKVLERVCLACPSLWNVEIDGVPGSVRYRWGYLALRTDSPFEEIWGEQIGDDLDGTISWGHVSQILEKNGFFENE